MADELYQPPDAPNLPCVHCNKPAVFCCKSCYDCPDDAISPKEASMMAVAKSWYCSPECYQAHHGQLTRICTRLEARKLAFRAAQLAKEVWFAYRAMMHEDGIERVLSDVEEICDADDVERDIKQLIVYDRKPARRSKKNEIAQKKMPSNPIDRRVVDSEDDYQSILSVNMCSISVLVLRPFIEDIFKNIAVGDKSLVTHLIRNQELLVSCVGSNGAVCHSDTYHTVLKVNIAPFGDKPGVGRPECYAIDLTGMQFGWPEVAMPWEQYSSSRIHQVTDVQPYAEAETRMIGEAVVAIAGDEDLRPSLEHCIRLHKSGSKIVSSVIALWLKHEHGWNGEWALLDGGTRSPKATTFAQLLRLPELQWQQHKENLLTAVHGILSWLNVDETEMLEGLMKVQDVPGGD